MTEIELKPDEGLLLTRDEIYQVYEKLYADNAHWAFTHTQRDADLEIAQAQLSKAQARCDKRVRGLIEFIEWLRDEEAVAQDDWDLYCKDKFEALRKGEG